MTHVRGMTVQTPCATIGSPMARSAKPELSSPVEPSNAHYKRSRSSLGFPPLQNAGRTPRHYSRMREHHRFAGERPPFHYRRMVRPLNKD
jgi:hypothetical protein